MSAKTILLYSSTVENATALMSGFRKIDIHAGHIVLVVSGTGVDSQQIKEIEQCGTEKIMIVHTGDDFAETISTALETTVHEIKPDYVIMMNDPFETEVAARLSVKIDYPCFTNCLQISEKDGEVQLDKMLYGGVVVGHYVSSKSLVCTLNENMCSDPLEMSGKVAEIIDVTVDTDRTKTSKTIVKREPVEKTVDLKNAQKIVSFGRGVSKEEDIRLIEQLAEVLDAQIGCSRPIVEDYKWMKVERQVGLTGTTVNPKLYVAVGISGQIQHAIGIKDAQTIVAINNNPNAPIFDIADYGIVGDLYEIVPKLVDSIKNHRA